MEVAEPASGLEDYADGNNWPFNFTEFFNSLLNFNHFIMVFYFCLFLVLVFSNHYVNWIYHKKNYTWWYFGQTRGQKSPKFWRELWPRPGAKGALAHFLNFNSFDVDVVVGTGRFFFFLFLPFLSWWSWSRLYTHQNHTHRRLGRCPVVSQFSLHLARERAT